MAHRIVRLAATLIFAAAMLGSASAQVSLTKGERRCVTSMNKGYQRLAKTYGRELLRCVEDASDPGATQTVSECVTAARASSRVVKLEGVLASIESSRCGAPPAYAFTGASTTAAAAIDQELALVELLFGPDLDAVISTDPTSCQPGALEAVQRCGITVLKAFNRCKRKAIRGPSDSGEPAGHWLTGECMREGIITEKLLTGKPRRLHKLCRSAIGNAVNSDCDFTQAPQLFPGVCGTNSQASLCLRNETPRVICRGLDIADALDVDGKTPGYCDLFND